MAVKEQDMETEANRICGWWCSQGVCNKARVPKAVAKTLLLKNTIIVAGQLRRICAKSVGAGIYDVWHEPWDKEE